MKITVFGPQGAREAQAVDLPALLASESGTVWVDIAGPTEMHVRIMADVFHFHPLAIEDTRNQRQRPKVEEYSEYLFLILNSFSAGREGMVFRELDVFVGRNYVVTVHQEAEPLIGEIEIRIDHTGAAQMSISTLLYIVLDVVVDAYFPVLDDLAEEIENLGDRVLTHPKPELLNRLFELKRELIDMWRVVWPQREMMNVLNHHQLPFIDQAALQPYLRDVSDHLLWIADTVNTFRDTLTGMMDLYMSAVSNRLNQVVNRLTVYTVVIGFMTVIGGFYGMNFVQTWPPFDTPWGVPFVIALMGGTVALLLVIFRKLKWY